MLEHRHDHGPEHSHEQKDEPAHEHARVSRPGLALLGMSGGLTPSPSAFLVLVTGFFSGRSGFALILAVCFGIGMAAVLFGVGLLALGGRNFVARFAESGRVLHAPTAITPVLAGLGVTALGIGLSSIAVTHLAGA